MKDIELIVKNLNIPHPQLGREKCIDNESNILSNRYVGTLYDEIFKNKVESINYDTHYKMVFNSIYKPKRNIPYPFFDISYDNIRRIVNRKYNENRYRLKVDESLILNTSKYLTKLFQLVDFDHYKASEIVLTQASLSFPITNRNHVIGGIIEHSVNPDIIIDDTIIELKTYDDIKFSHSDFVQLFNYFTCFNYLLPPTNDYIKTNPRVEKYIDRITTKRLGIYYAKHAYYWTFQIADLCSKEDLDCLITLFASKKNISAPNFSKEMVGFFNKCRK
jgi:hypothetical protein